MPARGSGFFNRRRTVERFMRAWDFDRTERTSSTVLLVLTATLTMAQSGRCVMEGFVVGEHDWPGISGASVVLIGDPNSPNIKDVQLTAVTEENGKYSLKEIPHGKYTLHVSAPGYEPYEIKIYMLSDTVTQLHVKLEKP
jgi:hypothetical protein